ncbi:MAG TPA: replication initiation protein, partial [Mycobacterium sp.]|nr:replication initiation protein [Mycobacterium sp.]
MAHWHADRPDLLRHALATTHEVAPQLDPLAEVVVPRMPRRMLATSTLKTDGASSGMMFLDAALAQQHIAIRTEQFAYAVAVDVDHADWADRLEDLMGHGLPRPTWIAADPWTGRAHFVWWLRDPVLLTPKGREAPRRLLDAVTQLLTVALNGDTAFTGLLTKNPWAVGQPLTRSGEPALTSLWESHRAAGSGLRYAVMPHPGLHDLGELRRALAAWQWSSGAQVPHRRRHTGSPQESARGSRLFDTLRARVYAAWPLSAAEVEAMSAEIAISLGSPIRDRQRIGMARRIYDWMRRRYTGRRSGAGRWINRGRDRRHSADLDLRGRQRVAGHRTAEQRQSASMRKLCEAAERLKAAGCRITRAALAAEAGLSERTVQRYRHALEGDKRCPSGIGGGVGAQADTAQTEPQTPAATCAAPQQEAASSP